MESRKSIYYNKYRLLQVMLVVGIFLAVVSCTSKPRALSPKNDDSIEHSHDAVNINTATAAELEKINSIGPKLALKIVEHRERYGSFRRAEHLMLIQGISDKRFRQIRAMVRVD